ncbi:MAG: hypothetical protein JSU95_08945 [Betaproteobacteria bacterium]|nr:MAG: hypothetical protein JSU95_08945 [Betaproteobacteria bacterium]
MMTRRLFLRSLLAVILTQPLAVTAFAHTPYRQWKVLRQRFLLVHSSRTDPVSDSIAEELVAILDQVLPQANAMVARAPDQQRIASLMTTGQAVLSVMRADQAEDLYQRRGEFRNYEGQQLRWLVAIGDYRLVTVTSFPRHHAWLVTAALTENGADLGIRPPASSGGGALPAHAGAIAFANGESLESQQ